MAVAAETRPTWFVVLDFEATCIENQKIKPPEVIEFPMVLVDAATGQIEAEFQEYVRPVQHPQLSDFCTELTGITQETVDAADAFPDVYERALGFLRDKGLIDSAEEEDEESGKSATTSWCFVTCGNWDLQKMLPAQALVSGLRTHRCFSHWCNIKTVFKTAYPKQRKSASGMMEMLAALGIDHRGRHHSGIDDCRNIAQIVTRMIEDEVDIRDNGWL